MAFERFKKLFTKSESDKAPALKEVSPSYQPKFIDKPKSRRNKGPRKNRSDRSPYTKKPSLAREALATLEDSIRRQPQAYRTDRLTLLEVADQIFQKEIELPRPVTLRAHHIFAMFTKKAGRVRSGVASACIEWRGAFKGQIPVITTVNSQAMKRIVVDARKYILENPPNGARRNFRSNPHALCGNARCVNPRHIEMRGLPQEMKSGENHARALFSDKQLQKLVREYNAGATAKEIAKKYKMSLGYVELVMRKKIRTEATKGMKIRGRFKTY